MTVNGLHVLTSYFNFCTITIDLWKVDYGTEAVIVVPGCNYYLILHKVVMVGITSKPKGFEAINIDLLQD